MKQKNVIFAWMVNVGIHVQHVIKKYALLVQMFVEIIYVKVLYVLIALYFAIYVKIYFAKNVL
jgi:hypothetical protein